MVGTAAMVAVLGAADAKPPEPEIVQVPASVGVHTVLPEPAALIATVAVVRTCPTSEKSNPTV